MGAGADGGAYGPYGQTTATTGTTTQLRYTDPETGYLYHRYYDANTAQFLARDALNIATRFCPRVRRQNCPLNCTDPSGLCNINPSGKAFWMQGIAFSAPV